jgi:hypothetical protein
VSDRLRRDQLELFPVELTAARSARSIDGLEVIPERPCYHCRATTAVIVGSTGPHAAAAECAGCGRLRQWLARECCEFLIEVVTRFGRPSDPIRIFEQVHRRT